MSNADELEDEITFLKKKIEELEDARDKLEEEAASDADKIDDLEAQLRDYREVVENAKHELDKV